MKSISEILDNPIKMPTVGLKKNDGGRITQSNRTKVNPSMEDCQKNQSTNGQKRHSVLLEHDLTGQKKLSALLLFCFDTLDTFGKEPEQLANVDKLFQFALKGYTVHQVESAFKQYIKSKTTMPKPADIIQIIEPTPQEKQWCKVTFLEIKRKKRENVFTTDEENKYIEDFVQAQVTAPADRRLELQNAVKQAQVDDKRYWLT